MQKKFISLLALALVAAASAEHHDEQAIGKLLDDFHAAAAAADKDRYLGYLSDDAVFMGTDEWERWPKHPDFTRYVEGRFGGGTGWTYESVERHITVAGSGDVAWFDEVVYSESNGRFRGTGVVIKNGDDWKIAHYAMSFLIFNENWQEVIELTRRTAVEKAAN